MSSIQETDKESREAVPNPKTRVGLADIEARILQRIDVTGHEAAGDLVDDPAAIGPLTKFSICILVMDNGFCVVGATAPTDPDNYVREIGRKFAYENAIRQLWPLFAFARLDVEKDRLGGGLYGG